jgi:hypothetical protein
MEGILARGDRRLSKVIYEAYKNGAIFDAWSEYFHNETWQAAFQSCEVDPNFYTTRERSFDEVLPWDFINTGVTKQFLQKEYENALKEIVTTNCREGCANCGATIFKGGICYEDKN